jgi:hypothetical protein
MMTWNAFVLLAGIVGGLLLGLNCTRITWRTSVVALVGFVLLGWAAGRYGVEAPDEADRAFIVDAWTERRVGVLFDAGRDAPDGELAGR